MKRIIPAAALAVLLGSGAAFAQQANVDNVQTVRDLAAVCDPATTGVPRLEAIAYCQGFLTSFGKHHASMHGAMHPAGGPGRAPFCVPNPGPSVAQSGVAFARWSRENPAHISAPALEGLMRWAQESFPCPTTARAPRAAR